MNDISLQDIYTIFTELLGLVYLFYRYFTGSDPSIPILNRNLQNLRRELQKTVPCSLPKKELHSVTVFSIWNVSTKNFHRKNENRNARMNITVRQVLPQLSVIIVISHVPQLCFKQLPATSSIHCTFYHF